MTLFMFGFLAGVVLIGTYGLYHVVTLEAENRRLREIFYGHWVDYKYAEYNGTNWEQFKGEFNKWLDQALKEAQ